MAVSFPADVHVDDIFNLLANTSALAVSASDATGKSLSLPKHAAEKGNNIMVTSPSNNAVKMLTKYQQQLSPNLNIGYATDKELMYDETSNIVYTTSAYIHNSLIKDNLKMDSFDILMLDNLHLGRLDDYTLLSLWKAKANSGDRVPRLLLASAYAAGFDLDDIPVYNITGLRYPVTVRYHKRNYDPIDPQLLEETAVVAYDIDNSSALGDILIFVNATTDALTLKRICLRMHLNAFTVDDFGPSLKPDSRKIIIVASDKQAVLSLSNIGVVIDTLTEEVREATLTGGLYNKVKYVSQLTAIQRCSFAGNSMSGLCYRMMTADMFSRLNFKNKHELERIPIDRILLEYTRFGLNPKDILTDMSNINLELEMQTLRKLKLLDGDNHITNIGSFVSKYPLGIKLGTTLWYWHEKGLPLYPAIVALTLIDTFGPGYLVWPSTSEDQTAAEYNLELKEHYKKYFYPFAGLSDIETWLNIWITMMQAIAGFDAATEDMREWVHDNSLNFSKLYEARYKVLQCIEISRRLGYKCDIIEFATLYAVDHLRPLLEITFVDSRFKLKETNDVRIQYTDVNEQKSYKIDSVQTANTISEYPPKEILALITSDIKSKYGNFGVINCSLNLL